MPTTHLTERSVTALPAPTDAAQEFYWDDDQPGLGVCVGRTGKTYVFLGRVQGKRRRVKLGKVGTMTVERAREAAKVVAGQLAAGTDPNASKRRGVAAPTKPAAPGQPTLRDGMVAHVARMTAKGRSERTIATFEHELEKYLAAWLDRPFAELTGEVMADLHAKIMESARAKGNANPANPKGAPLANRVTMHVSAAFNSLNKKLSGRLGSWNPVKSVDKVTLKPKGQRVLDLADYAARVATMRNPIQRDGLMLALHTGLRSEDVRTIRFEHVDWDAATLTLPDPKGGAAAAFVLPLSATPMEILERRRDENAHDLGSDDGGFAFPAHGNERTEEHPLGIVGPIGDLREQRHSKKSKLGRFPTEDVHSLRRTWTSIAHEEGVSELDQHVLSNHVFGSRDVHEIYIRQHIDTLRASAQRIDDGVQRRIKSPTPPAKSKPRGKLKLAS